MDPQTKQPARQCWRRSIAILAVLSVLAQALLAAFAVPAAFAARQTGAVPDGYSQILICTGSAMKRIIVDAQGNRVDHSDEGQAFGCAACHFTGCAAIGSPAAPVASVPVLFAHFPPLPVLRTVSAGAGHLYPHSRGPPSPVIRPIA